MTTTGDFLTREDIAELQAEGIRSRETRAERVAAMQAEHEQRREFDRIVRLVWAERRRQDELWGANRNLLPQTWLAILTEEVGEVARCTLDADEEPRTDEELVQVIAVGVAWLEARRRFNCAPCLGRGRRRMHVEGAGVVDDYPCPDCSGSGVSPTS